MSKSYNSVANSKELFSLFFLGRRDISDATARRVAKAVHGQMCVRDNKHHTNQQYRSDGDLIKILKALLLRLPPQVVHAATDVGWTPLQAKTAKLIIENIKAAQKMNMSPCGGGLRRDVKVPRDTCLNMIMGKGGP